MIDLSSKDSLAGGAKGCGKSREQEAGAASEIRGAGVARTSSRGAPCHEGAAVVACFRVFDAVKGAVGTRAEAAVCCGSRLVRVQGSKGPVSGDQRP